MSGVKRRFLCGVIVSLTLAVGAPLTALASDVGNGSFEDGDFPQGVAFQMLTSGTPGATSITGWTVTAGSIDWIDGFWTAQDGTKSLDMNGLEPGAISQTLTTSVNSTWAIQFYLAGNPDCGDGVKTLTVSATGAPPQTYTFTNTSATTHADMGWTLETYTFVATGTSTDLTFAADPANPSFCGPALDDVSATVTVPVELTGADCKDGGWRSMKDEAGSAFRNQGDCVSSFATDGETPIGSR
jgi:choice-of-anchor C domain-containing protein